MILDYMVEICIVKDESSNVISIIFEVCAIFCG